MPKPLHSLEYQHFLDELREARARAGITRWTLASRIGEDQTFVSKCELGVRRLDVVELRRWVRALDLTRTDFTRDLERRLDRNRPVATPRRR